MQKLEWVTLTRLVEEGHAKTPGRLVDLLHDRGDAVGVNAGGFLAVLEPVADRLRAEKAEAARLARLEEERIERERATARAELEAKAAVEREQVERQQRLARRVTRLQNLTGVRINALEGELRRQYTHAPDSAISVRNAGAWEEVTFTIDDLEEFAKEKYGISLD